MKSKILKITGITLLVLVTFVCAAPWLFKGQVTRLIKSHISKNLRAQVNFTGVNISLFRHFPKISFGLDSLQVTCVGEFQGDTLMTAKQFDLACDIKSLFSGDSISVYSITIDEPRFHARIHKDGHANWNIGRPEKNPDEGINTSTRTFNLGIQRYAIHKGNLDFQDERRDLHVVVQNLEHEGRGNFNAEQFTLKTKTSADLVNFDFTGAIPYQVSAKTSIDLVFRVENKSHTYSFNSDQVAFNDLKLHTEGFFQWINDSSYSMNIKFKSPSTKFKNILSMMPAVYQKDFASIETNGQVNFNGFIKGRWDEKHFPAYHANLFVQNGFFKYPDLPIPVENINIGVQLDNPDGLADHLTLNVSQMHAEINKDTLDMHLLVRNLKSRPFIDFSLVGKTDLANISKYVKLESGTKVNGLVNANFHAKGIIPESGNQKKDAFQSWGNFDLANFSWVSSSFPGGIALSELFMTFNSKNVLIKQLQGEYCSTQFGLTGTLNNLFDFAVRNKPLKAVIDFKADELNLRDWLKTNRDTSATASGRLDKPFEVPDNIDFTINAVAEKLHYDNLDLQNISGKLLISDQKVQMQQVRANGLDGQIEMAGVYSTLSPGENPEIALTYDVKGLDIQKTFFAFNTIRRIMPVAKFMAGNINAHMTLNGRLRDDMTTDLQTLQGEGNVQLLSATLKDFGPMDKLIQSLDITELKDMPMQDIKADFSFQSGSVTVSPFLAYTKDIEMEICGIHGFDQSLEYDVSLKVPRNQLGSKGKLFVKNVVTQAADKGIPVKLNDAVRMDVKMKGTFNNPEVNTDMDAVVDNAATDLKKEVNAFVNAKLDSAKQQLHHPAATPKKSLFVQTGYKSKNSAKAKKSSKSAHKKTTHTKSVKKKKKPVRSYTHSSKKEKSTASNSRR